MSPNVFSATEAASEETEAGLRLMAVSVRARFPAWIAAWKSRLRVGPAAF